MKSNNVCVRNYIPGSNEIYDWFTIQNTISVIYMNSLNNKKHMITLIFKKAVDKSQYQFMIKTQQTRNRGECLQLDKTHLQKSNNLTAKIILFGE